MTVKVYSTPDCPWCRKAKEYLKVKNIPFEDIDVSTDMQAATDMVQKSGQRGVPVLEIDGQIVIGFNPRKIDELTGR
jgi:Glutaredoxin-like protein, YruB-family